jgi:hypothetical protein
MRAAATTISDRLCPLIGHHVPLGIGDFEGGIAGYYSKFNLSTLKEVIQIFAGF